MEYNMNSKKEINTLLFLIFYTFEVSTGILFKNAKRFSDYLRVLIQY